MHEKELQPIIDEFRDILKDRGHNWDINQLHAYFAFDQRWSPNVARNLWRTFFKNEPKPGTLDLYMHIPFCRSKCRYCPFKSWILKDVRQIDDYIDYLIDEMDFFKKTFQGLSFDRLFVGGGTPSILSVAQLDRLMTHLFESFSFRKNSRKTFECHPDVIDDEKLRLLRKKGFTKINLGVNSLNAKALKANQRSCQTYEKVRKAILSARREGFRHVSVDLIFGLAGDTLSDFARTFERVAGLAPADIIIHGLKIPDARYLSELLKMDPRQYYRRYYPKMRDRALEILKKLSRKHGYSHAPGKIDPSRWQWGFIHKDYADLGRIESVYTGEYTGCGSILGLGINARSHIFGTAEYRQIKQPRPFGSGAIIFEGKKLTQREEMVKFILNHMDKNANIPGRMFRRFFGAEISEAFPHALFALKSLGKIFKGGDDLIRFRFREPEEKYICALFFLREAKLV